MFLKSSVFPLSLETRKKPEKNFFLKKILIFTLAKFASGALFDFSDDEGQFSFVLTKIIFVKILLKFLPLESKGPKASMFSRMIESCHLLESFLHFLRGNVYCDFWLVFLTEHEMTRNPIKKMFYPREENFWETPYKNIIISFPLIKKNLLTIPIWNHF